MRCLALDIGGTKIAAAIVKNGEIEQRQLLQQVLSIMVY